MQLVERNQMFEKMRAGEPVLGCQVRSRSVLLAELMAYCGLDYVFIEGEHFVHNIESIENEIRAVQLAGSVPIVRVPSHEDGLILQILEAGAMGVIFPHIDTREQAEHAVNSVKFPPVGKRGYGDAARASKFGFVPDQEYMECVNRNVIAIGMIESQEGIDNLDEILKSGIDVLRIGAKDLSLNLGYGGKVTPEVRKIVEEVCRRISASPVILGDAGLGGLSSPEDFKAVAGLGCKMFTVGADLNVLKKSLVASVNKFTGYKAELSLV